MKPLLYTAPRRLLSKVPPHTRSIHPIRHRFLSSTTPRPAKNRVYTSIRSPSDLDTLLLLSASSRIPLLTFWTASWCPSCKTVGPLLRRLIAEEGTGEEHGSVGYVEVEFDAPENGELGMRYLITSIPTLLSFSRQEAQLETKVTGLTQLKDGEYLKRWIESEARRGGHGGSGGGSILSGLFGGKS